MKKEVKEMQFGKFYMYYNIIPCIEICNDKGKAIGYLSAFRDYSFQVSGSWDGEMDLGSTEVFGLHTFGRILQTGRSNIGQETTVKYFISIIAYSAIIKAAENLSRWEKDEDGERNILLLPPKGNEYGTFFANKEWEKFVDSCYDRYVNYVNEVPNAPYYDPELAQVVDPATEAV